LRAGRESERRQQRSTVGKVTPRATRLCGIPVHRVPLLRETLPNKRAPSERVSILHGGFSSRIVRLGALAMNVVISHHATHEVLARYEIHLARGDDVPPDSHYFEAAWNRAVDDGFVDPEQRSAYDFQLQRPKTLYEASV
jgi:hypothetical protein